MLTNALLSLKGNTNHLHEIDIGLLNDLFENHYPTIKSLWRTVINLIKQRDNINKRINEIIEEALKDKLDEAGIKYKLSMYGLENSRINAIPIKEVRGEKSL